MMNQCSECGEDVGEPTLNVPFGEALRGITGSEREEVTIHNVLESVGLQLGSPDGLYRLCHECWRTSPLNANREQDDDA